jgi:hypothetical protein
MISAALLATAAGWRLVGPTPTGADVLAMAATPPGEPCRSALRRLRDGEGVLVVTQAEDRLWRWALTDGRGAPIAASPPVYRDAASCRRAFHDAQRAARTAPERQPDRAGV